MWSDEFIRNVVNCVGRPIIASIQSLFSKICLRWRFVLNRFVFPMEDVRFAQILNVNERFILRNCFGVRCSERGLGFG